MNILIKAILKFCTTNQLFKKVDKNFPKAKFFLHICEAASIYRSS